MRDYRVKIKYGNPGEYKHNSQDVTVKAVDETAAAQLAINKFKSSNAAYKNKDVDVVQVKEI